MRTLTVAQAIVHFLNQQYVERDGKKTKFFAGIWGIFGHGNVAGLGQALEEIPSLRYYQARNEQAMVHAAVAYAKQSRRLSTFACTSSIGPGSTNMLTAAAGASINRLPVLLLPGDLFSKRQKGPVLQQLEYPSAIEVSVNDCFKPVSKFWDRIHRWEQLPESLYECMRILTSPSETGAVTLCLPQDVQTEAGNFDERLFEERNYSITRPQADSESLQKAVHILKQSKRPLILAGGGIVYSEAEHELAEFCAQTKIPCVETQAGKASLPASHAQNLGAIGVTGTFSANHIATQADVILAIGTRLSDFTTASGTQYSKDAKWISVNLNSHDAYKYNALPLIGDCKRVLSELKTRMESYSYSPFYQEDYTSAKTQWMQMRASWVDVNAKETISQSQVLGILNQSLHKEDTLVSAAGSLPGDMHKLLNLQNSSQYHMEYGYSCMGYEIAGGLGVRMQKASGEVFVLVGDGSYLMMHSEILTSIQEQKKIIIILIVNHKFACIDNLSKSVGSSGFGNEFRYRSQEGLLDGEFLNVDYIANAKSYGADASLVSNSDEFVRALKQAREGTRTHVIAVNVSESANVPGFETQWNVPVAEVSQSEIVQHARKRYESVFSRHPQ